MVVVRTALLVVYLVVRETLARVAAASVWLVLLVCSTATVLGVVASLSLLHWFNAARTRVRSLR